MADIFLSYSRQDKDLMQRLRGDLLAAGFTVWTDDVGLEPGTPSWQRAIEEAIQAAPCAVVLMSPEAKKSKWVEIEVSLAEDLGLRIFPLLVRGQERNAVLFRLLTTQRIDLRQDYQQAITEQLIPTLQRFLQPNNPQRARATERAETPKVGPSVRTPSGPWWMRLDLGSLLSVVLLLLLAIGTRSYWQNLFIKGAVATPTSSTAVTLSTLVQLALATNTLTATITSTPMSTPTPKPQPTNTLPMRATATAQPPTPTSIPTATFTSLPTATSTNTPLPSTNTPIPPTATSAPTPTVTIITKIHLKEGAVYVWIPPGAFMMGSSITDTLAYTNERPQHEVVLDGFWIMQTEVTKAQYKRCVDAKACEPLPSDTHLDDPEYAQHPVIGVGWNEAKTYAAWVGGRLPTEAEWEMACRGTDGRIYPWGNTPPNEKLLNYHESDKHDTKPVGSYPPGANGLYDMAGNVQEWTSSLSKAYPYKPDDGREDPEAAGPRVLRGGSMYAHDVRCAQRFWWPGRIRIIYDGFRVVFSGF